MDKRTSYWLIEAPGPRWMQVSVASPSIYWTSDATKAIAFADQRSADQMLVMLRSIASNSFAFERNLSQAFVSEHVDLSRESTDV